MKKIQMSRFMNTELKSDSDPDSDLDSAKVGSKFDNEKLEKSGSDSEWDVLLSIFAFQLF